MEFLYPQNYVTPDPVSIPPRDTAELKTFIKSLVKDKPVRIEDIIKMVDSKYVDTNNEDYHFLPDEIVEVVKEIDNEWRPQPEPEPDPESEI